MIGDFLRRLLADSWPILVVFAMLAIAVFFLLRELLTWYWKINEALVRLGR